MNTLPIDPARLDLEALHLESGTHPPGDRMSLLEAVAYVAGEPWSDHPRCACPVIAAFLRTWNDALPDDLRQSLKRYLSRLVSSRSTATVEEQRSYLALDWLVRTHTPAWLRLAGLTEHAAALEVAEAITDPDRAQALNDTVFAAGDAARDAAWAAARDAARDAAWAAAGDAAWDAAGDAARAAAWAATGDAARAAAWAAAWDAAGDAAWAKLKPTRARLIASAHDLIERMLAEEDQP